MATENDYLAVTDQNGDPILGDSAVLGYAHDFTVGSYSLGVESTSPLQGGATEAEFQPLTVTLDANIPGVNTLTADAGTGAVLRSVTLDVTTSAGVLERVVLTNATVVQAQVGAGATAFSFDYQQIAITPYYQNALGALVQGTRITETAAAFTAPPEVAVSTAPPGGANVYLHVDGVTGPVTTAPYAGDFQGASFEFQVGPDGTAGPLTVTLNQLGNDEGVTNLESLVSTGATIPELTLDVVKTVSGTGQQVVEQVELTDARVTSYSEPGGNVQLSFSYQSATLTSSAQNTDGTYGPAQMVTLTSGSSGTDDAPVTPGTTSSETDYLAVTDQNGVAIDGGSTAVPFTNDFVVFDYSLGTEATAAAPGAGAGKPLYQPLTVTLASNTPGVNALTADAGNGAILKSVTLFVTSTAGTLEQVVLTNAKVVEAQVGAGGTAISFEYQQIAITPYYQNNAGTLVQGTKITETPAGFTAPPTVTVPTAPPPSTTAYLQVTDPGSPITGPVTTVPYTGDFQATAFQFTVGQGGTAGPLTVTLSQLGSGEGVSNLEALVATGAVIPSVTLDVVRTVAGGAQVLQQIVLTDAQVISYSEAGGPVQLSFDYKSATLTSSPQNVDGTLGTPQTVTLTGASSAGSGSDIPGTTSGENDFLAITDQNGAQIDGGATSAQFTNDFVVGGYSLGTEASQSTPTAGGGSIAGKPLYQPFTVTLAANDPGVNTLTADAANGAVLKSVTLYVTTTAGTLEQVVLTNATVVQAQVGAGGTAFAFDYQQIAITPFHPNASGALVAGTKITESPQGFVSPPDVTVPTAPANSAQMYLQVQDPESPITGPVTTAPYTGDFQATNFQFAVTQDGGAGPLTVTLGELGSDEGVTNLEALVASGTTLTRVTLDVVTSVAGGTHVLQQIVLTDARVTGYSEAGGPVQITFSYAGATLTSSFQNEDGSFGTAQTVTIGSTAPCYCRGTRIRTAAGEVPVEQLQIGDLLLTAAGALRPVRWLGSRRINCVRHTEPVAVWPICIRAQAFAEQLPARDLWLSPGHAVFVNGVLIQAEKLVNGATILQVPQTSVEYWHVELDSHDVIVAEGLAAESYLDTGNRSAFANGGAFIDAYPDFRPKQWSETCAPLILEGPELERVKTQLLERAHALGFATSPDSDVHIVADDARYEPVALSATRLMFVLPQGCASIELRSRTFVPEQVNARSHDGRVLGLCVGRLQVDGDEISAEEEAAFASGWHRLERYPGGRSHRWTTGRTPLPAASRLVILDIAGPGFYWVGAAAQQPQPEVQLRIVK